MTHFCKLPAGYSCEINADGATLLRTGEVVHRYGPNWSPIVVSDDAWRHAVEIEDEILELNELLRQV